MLITRNRKKQETISADIHFLIPLDERILHYLFFPFKNIEKSLIIVNDETKDRDTRFKAVTFKMFASDLMGFVY